MTDGEINRKFDLVAQHVASVAVSDEKGVERIDRIDRQIEHLSEAFIQLTVAHTQTQQTTVELQESRAEMQRAMARLAESQVHIDRRLNALIDIVREDRERREGREGKDGEG